MKAVDGDELRRLTSTPHVNEVQLAWSPDGRQIAFVRLEVERIAASISFQRSEEPERKVSDSGWRPSWLPDSQSLVFEDRRGLEASPQFNTSSRRAYTAN